MRRVFRGHKPGFQELGPQMAFALAGFVAVQMFLAGLAAFELTVGGNAKTLPRGLVRFLFRHGSNPPLVAKRKKPIRAPAWGPKGSKYCRKFDEAGQGRESKYSAW